HEHLVEEVLERQLTGTQLLRRGLRLVLIYDGLGLLDEREHITHAEDAAGHALRVEDIEVLELLTGGGEHDRLAGDLTDGQGGTTTGVTVELGEHDTGEINTVA